MYFPSENDTIKITGALLQQGMMGSNISYEDMMEPDILRSRYEASISGEETINDRPCLILTLKAFFSAVAYSKRVIWVDKEHFFAMKTELYSRGGQLLKTTLTLSTEKIGQRYFPIKIGVVEAKISIPFDDAQHPAWQMMAGLTIPFGSVSAFAEYFYAPAGAFHHSVYASLSLKVDE